MYVCLYNYLKQLFVLCVYVCLYGIWLYLEMNNNVRFLYICNYRLYAICYIHIYYVVFTYTNNIYILMYVYLYGCFEQLCVSRTCSHEWYAICDVYICTNNTFIFYVCMSIQLFETIICSVCICMSIWYMVILNNNLRFLYICNYMWIICNMLYIVYTYTNDIYVLYVYISIRLFWTITCGSYMQLFMQYVMYIRIQVKLIHIYVYVYMVIENNYV